MKLYYRKTEGYKYTVHEKCSYQTNIKGFDIKVVDPEGTLVSALTPDGLLTAYPEYSWDGSSGPTHDDNTNMRGSLHHDQLYQMMRLGFLPQKFRKEADNIMLDCLARDGMNVMRRGLWYASLRIGAAGAAKRQFEDKFKIYSAP